MHSGFGLFTEEHDAFRKLVRKVVNLEIKPHVAAWEEAEEFPRALFSRFAELGFLGLKYSPDYGGTDAGFLYEAVLHEELGACGSGGVAAGLGAQFTIATGPIHQYGTEAQKRRFLAPAIAGLKIGALGVTEPGAGSDVAGLATSARLKGDRYVVKGAKTYITNGVRADFVVVAVKTDPSRGHKGLSLLIVEKGTPGFTVGK